MLEDNVDLIQDALENVDVYDNYYNLDYNMALYKISEEDVLNKEVRDNYNFNTSDLDESLYFDS